jgi:hypothetical protein
MRRSNLKHSLAVCAVLCMTHSTGAFAQVTETVGSRALGMGGAFVAVANDNSATWWNPAGLATGPFLDLGVAHATTQSSDDLPARRDTARGFALATPPFGLSYYRVRLSDSGQLDPTVTESVNRQDGGAGIPVRSVAAGQLGITVVQTLLPGVHAGATLKYLRGTVRTGVGVGLVSADALLDLGDDLEGGEADNAFDADIGVIAVGGGLRTGLLVRNAFESRLENSAGSVRLERQFRVGLAYAAADAGGWPLTIAVDADLSTIATASGDRRNVAIGAEYWLWNRRAGIRGGVRVNTTGLEERAVTAGGSVAVRAGLFVDAHVVGGGTADDRGWGAALRVSF